MPEEKGNNKPQKNLTSPSLISLKPRQVLLAEHQQRRRRQVVMAAKKQPELKHSILSYLHNNGFSKTLKRFLKEAQIQGDDWKETAVDLEDIYSRYLVNSQQSDVKNTGHIRQDGTVGKDASDHCGARETLGKKKNRDGGKEKPDRNAGAANSEQYSKSVDSDDGVVKDFVTATKTGLKEKKNKKRSDSVGQNVQDGYDSRGDLKEYVPINEQKDKSKKKTSSQSQMLDDNVKKSEILTVLVEKKPENSKVLDGFDKSSEDAGKAKDKKEKKKLRTVALDEHGQEGKHSIVGRDDDTDVVLKDCSTKSKVKKKKKETLVSESNEPDLAKKGALLQNGAKEESKKRKAIPSVDEETQPVEKLINRESKRRKITEVGLEYAVVGGDGDAGENEENIVNSSQREILKADQAKNGVHRSAERKSLGKQRNGSNEPRTANAFQRVKVDEVNFVDERLQDNSYWAKDGAENGYGAKAQEVLGQVKGRGFRHEKTKKKRGSYRGGQIDFQSHSIKFNYSDEE